MHANRERAIFMHAGFPTLNEPLHFGAAHPRLAATRPATRSDDNPKRSWHDTCFSGSSETLTVKP